MNKTADLLRHYRTLLGLSQKEVAKELGLKSYQAYSRYESEIEGIPRQLPQLKHIMALEKLLNIPHHLLWTALQDDFTRSMELEAWIKRGLKGG